MLRRQGRPTSIAMTGSAINGSLQEVVMTIRVLAQGLVEVHQEVIGGGILRQDDKMPKHLRRGLALLSRICLMSGHHEDLGVSSHSFVVLASKPVGEWGPSLLRDGEMSDLVLMDSDCGVPTEECRDVAAGEDESIENSLFKDFMDECREGGERAFYPKDSFAAAEKRLQQMVSVGFTPHAMLWLPETPSQEKHRPAPDWRAFQKRWARPAIIHAVDREAA